MKRTISFLFTVLFFCCNLSYAAELEFSYEARSGDRDLDISLKKLNIRAGGDKENFIRQMSISYGLSNDRLRVLVVGGGMAPADVYMAIRLSRTSGKSFDYVLGEFKKSKGKGWGVISKRLGIKPGSPQFHELKKEPAGFLDAPGNKKKGPKLKKKKGNREKGR
jgi:hypothetical protein